MTNRKPPREGVPPAPSAANGPGPVSYPYRPPEPPTEAPRGRHPVTSHLPFGDSRAMAAYWGKEAAWAIGQALTNPAPMTIEDLNLDHAVRCTRMAAWHALRILGRPTWKELSEMR